jgi:ketosteroid isomerase-like protein
MRERADVETMREIFAAIERRDNERFAELVRPDLELHWPPSLPYGGTTRGREPDRATWGRTWQALQPTEAERRMDPRVVAASGEEVVVLWRQRGLSPSGERLDTQVLGLYRLIEGTLARGQMFYFDPVAVAAFLAAAAEAESDEPAALGPARPTGG